MRRKGLLAVVLAATMALGSGGAAMAASTDQVAAPETASTAQEESSVVISAAEKSTESAAESSASTAASSAAAATTQSAAKTDSETENPVQAPPGGDDSADSASSAASDSSSSSDSAASEDSSDSGSSDETATDETALYPVSIYVTDKDAKSGLVDGVFKLSLASDKLEVDGEERTIYKGVNTASIPTDEKIAIQHAKKVTGDSSTYTFQTTDTDATVLSLPAGYYKLEQTGYTEDYEAVKDSDGAVQNTTYFYVAPVAENSTSAKVQVFKITKTKEGDTTNTSWGFEDVKADDLVSTAARAKKESNDADKDALLEFVNQKTQNGSNSSSNATKSNSGNSSSTTTTKAVSYTAVVFRFRDSAGKVLQKLDVRLQDSKGATVDSWTTTDKYHVAALPDGTYTLQQKGGTKYTDLATVVVSGGKVTKTTSLSKSNSAASGKYTATQLKSALEKSDLLSLSSTVQTNVNSAENGYLVLIKRTATSGTTTSTTGTKGSSSSRTSGSSSSTASKIKSPGTGDYSPITLYVVLAAAAAAGLGGALYVKRRSLKK